MHPSLFKALSSSFYWLWVIYHMGKHSLISKGSTNHSVVLATTVRVLLQLPYSVPLFIHCTVLCGISMR